jgi:branched-chain amino acid transport system substrate-binding protein
MRRLPTLAFVLAFVAFAHAAEPGVTAQKIFIGASAPLTGPQALYGRELEHGLHAAFAQVNAAGGIHGRAIELLMRDDAGQPERAVANTRELLAAGVIALTGYHGAASIEAVLPIVEQAGVPLVGAASSAEVLREPARRTVFNLRAGAREEAAAIVLQLDTIGLTEIAVAAQDDAFGAAGLEGIKVELVRLAMKPLAVQRLPSSASAAQQLAVAQAICKRPPQALVLALDARNTLAVIRATRKAGCAPQFYVMSEAGAQLATGDVMTSGELAGVVVSQVVPHPLTAPLPVGIDYRRQLGNDSSPASYMGLEGFIYARVIAETLLRFWREPSAKCVINSLESRPIDAGGYRVQFAPGDRRGSKFVEMTIVTQDGRFRR